MVVLRCKCTQVGKKGKKKSGKRKGSKRKTPCKFGVNKNTGKCLKHKRARK